VGGRVIAHGEVLVVEGNYGLRVSEVISPQQRLIPGVLSAKC
jgi:hypothetical protein